MHKKRTKLSWQTPVFQSISCFLAIFCWFCPYFYTGSPESHTEEDTVYGRHKTVPNSDTVSSKLHFFKEDVKGEIEQKVHSWDLTVKGKQVWTRPLKCSPDICLSICVAFPHFILATRVKVYSKFFLSDERGIQIFRGIQLPPFLFNLNCDFLILFLDVLNWF